MSLLRVVQLEDRILFDGALAADVANVHATPAPATLIAHDSPVHVLVISQNMPEYQTLVHAVKDPNEVVVIYDYNTQSLDGLGAKISSALNGQKADSITFATEGNVGAFQLVQGHDVNNTTIKETTMANFWKNISSELTQTGSVDILGCNVAQGTTGTTMLSNLDALLDSNGANITIHASTDLTGSASLGGNWILEYATTPSSTPVDVSTNLFDPAILNTWTHTLDSGPNLTVSIWKDVNLTGVKASNDPSVNGISVELFDSSGNIVQTAITDSTGTAHFSLLTPNAKYYIEGTLVDGYQVSALDFTSTNGNSTLTSTITGANVAESGLFQLPNDTSTSSISVGLKFYVSGVDASGVTGVAWHDANNNGVQDNSESGVSNVQVSLYANYQNGAQSLVRTTTTDSNGNYTFANLAPGGGGQVIEFVIDNSGSTSSLYPKNSGDTLVGDLNGNHTSNQVIDGELAAFQYLLNGLIRDGFGDTAKVGLVVFGNTATQVSLNTAHDTALTPNQLIDSSTHTFNSDFQNIINNTFKSNSGSTNYESALEKAITFFQNQNAQPNQSTLFFLSDGLDNRGNLNLPEVSTLVSMGIDRYAFGIGSGSSLQYLSKIDAGAIKLSTLGQLVNFFSAQSFGITGYQVEFGLPNGFGFTTKNAGTSPAIFSSVDPSTGFTSSFSILDGTTKSAVNAGFIDAPPNIVAANQTYVLDENSSLNITAPGVLFGDSVPSGSIVSAVLNGSPTHDSATFTLNSDGSFLYTPVNGFYGVDTFTYHITDGTTNSNIATVTLNVLASLPVATNENFTAFVNTSQTLNVLANDTDPNNLPLSINKFSQPSNGTLVLNSDGTLTYTPNSNYTGPDSFTYNVTDNIKNPDGTLNVSAVGIVNLNVTGPSVTVNLWKDINLTGTQAANDPAITGVSVQIYNASTNALVATGTTDSSGSVTFSQLAGNTTYFLEGTLANGYQFSTITLTNTSGTTTLTGTIGTGNVAESSTFQLPNDTSTTSISVGLEFYDSTANATTVGGTVWNDANQDGIQNFSEQGISGITVTLFADYQNSTLGPKLVRATTTDSSGLYSFGNLPAASGGVDLSTITGYQVQFGLPNDYAFTTENAGTSPTIYSSADPTTGLTSSFTVSAGTSNSNVDAGMYSSSGAITAANQTYTVAENGTLTITSPGVLSGDSVPTGSSVTAVLDTPPAQGTFSFNANGSFTYTPATNSYQSESFTYHISLGTTNSNIATVTLNVLAPPPVATADSYTALQNTAMSIAAGAGVLANDTDPNNLTLTATAVTESTTAGGSVTFNTDGSFVYTPPTGFSGQDTFTYSITDNIINPDGTLNFSVGKVTMTVIAPPGINAVSYNTIENTQLTVGATGVFTEDTDPNGQGLAASAITETSTAGGSVVISQDGSFTYTPPANFFGQDSFTYTVNDGLTASDGTLNQVAGTVSIDVVAPPVASNDSYTASRSTPNYPQSLTVNGTTLAGLLSNDSDPNTNPLLSLTAVIDTLPANGTITNLNGTPLAVGDTFDGTFIYTPNNEYFSYNGPDTFTYHDNNGVTDSNIATVSIDVHFIKPATNPSSYIAIFNSQSPTPLVIPAANGVLANDSNVYNETLTATIVSGTGPNNNNGLFTLNPDGSFTYTPTAVGIDSFTYIATDTFTYKGLSLSFSSDPTSVNITVVAPPVANPDSYSVYQNGLLSGSSVLANDTDPNTNSNQFLTVNDYSQPAHGTVVVGTNGSFVYIPTPGYQGTTDSFTYQVTDGVVASDGTLNTGTGTVTISLVSPPVPVSDSYTVAENQALNVPIATGVIANDSNPLGTPLTARIQTTTANGQITLNGDGSFTYTPNAGFFGTDTFTYYDNYGTIDSNTASVTNTITVVAPPIAQNDNAATNTNQSVNIVVLTNDTDPNTPALPLTVDANTYTQPGHGQVILNPDGTFTYTPNSLYFGLDHFTYQVSNGVSDSNVATVDIQVNFIKPTANNVTYYNGENHILHIDNTNTVTGNNTLLNSNNVFDSFGLPLTAVLDSGPTHTDPNAPNFVLNPDGTFIYNPAPGFFGTDSFTYHVNDGLDNSNKATVTIQVIAPPSAVNDVYNVNTNNILTINAASGVLSNDTDSNNLPATLPFTVTVVPGSGPDNASAFSLNSDGSFTYTPNFLFAGTDTFNYQVTDAIINSDGTHNVSTATVSIIVHFLNPSANVDNYTVNRNTVLQVTDPNQGVLKNDTNNYNTAMVAILDAAPAHGTFTDLNGTPITVGEAFDGTFIYTPNIGFFGTDTFQYHAQDTFIYNGHNVSFNSNVVTDNITVVSVPPTAVSHIYSTSTDTPFTVSNSAVGLLQNATDPYNEPLTVIHYTQPSNGTVSVNPDGTFTYTPNHLFTGDDSFTYQINDGASTSTSATVTIHVDFIRPAVNNDIYTTNRNTLLTVAAPGLLSNDSDTFNLPLSIASYTNPSHGHLTLNADGSFSYIPDLSFYGTDSFTYIAQDIYTYRDTSIAVTSDPQTPAVVTITVVSIPPVAANDSYNVGRNTTLQVTAPSQGILANDTDIYKEPLTPVNVTQPAHGTLMLNSDGTFTYTPHFNFYGTDSFTYQVNDGATTSNVATVTFHVNTLPPNGQNDSYQTNENVVLSTNVVNGVLSNDTDPYHEQLISILYSAPSHGTLTLSTNGSFVYTPNKGFFGIDTFTYSAVEQTVIDKIGASTPLTLKLVEEEGVVLNPVTVSITVLGFNPPFYTAPISSSVFVTSSPPSSAPQSANNDMMPLVDLSGYGAQNQLTHFDWESSILDMFGDMPNLISISPVEMTIDGLGNKHEMFTVTLTEPPVVATEVKVAAYDRSQPHESVPLSKDTLTFTPENWFVPQTVELTAHPNHVEGVIIKTELITHSTKEPILTLGKESIADVLSKAVVALNQHNHVVSDGKVDGKKVNEMVK